MIIDRANSSQACSLECRIILWWNRSQLTIEVHVFHLPLHTQDCNRNRPNGIKCEPPRPYGHKPYEPVPSANPDPKTIEAADDINTRKQRTHDGDTFIFMLIAYHLMMMVGYIYLYKQIKENWTWVKMVELVNKFGTFAKALVLCLFIPQLWFAWHLSQLRWSLPPFFP